MMTIRSLALPLLLTLCAAPAARAQFMVAYHDATGAGHQAQFDNLSVTGYRMIALTIYGTNSDLRYAAVWVKRNGPTYLGFHGKTASEYQSLVNTFCPQGYTARLLSATGSASNPRFAGVLDLTNKSCYIRHGLTEQGYFDELKAARDNGYRVTTADVYGTSGDPRYIVGFEKNDADIGWGWIVSAGNAGYQTHFDAFNDTWARPAMVAFNDSQRFFQMWHDNSVGPWIAHHDMTEASYQNLFNQYLAQNYYPISLDAAGSGNSRRFAAVWAQTEIPVGRQWTAGGTAVPGMAMFDNWAKSVMQTKDARAGALAIVKDCRLVFARSYNWAEPGYPITQPDALFRIASCSKPMTSIAVHQHMENMPAAIGYTNTMVGYLNPPFILDNWTNLVDVGMLLAHQGGWDRDVSFDPMFRDVDISNTLSINLPIAKTHVFKYMTETKFLDFYPGTASKYSNYGFSLLGQILEDLNPGSSYAQIMRRDVFQPLGLTRPLIGGSLIGQIHPAEVRYHPKNPYIAKSVNSQSQPWVAGQYGGWNSPNMDSHGAWVMAAPDFAKMLAAFDLGNNNPLMSQSATDDMWTVVTGSTMRGWFLKMVDDGVGGKLEMYHHNGGLPGTATVIARREDNISFVWFTNSDSWMGGTDEGVELSDLANTVVRWPNHDLFPNFKIPSLKRRVPGRMTQYGISCGGAAAPTTLSGSGTPEVNETLSLDLSNAPAGTSAFAMIGFGPSAISLGRVGAPGCTLYTVPVATLGTTTGRSGTAAIPITVPDEPALVGAHAYAQYAVMAPGANNLGLTTTNGLDILLGGWQ